MTSRNLRPLFPLLAMVGGVMAAPACSDGVRAPADAGIDVQVGEVAGDRPGDLADKPDQAHSDLAPDGSGEVGDAGDGAADLAPDGPDAAPLAAEQSFTVKATFTLTARSPGFGPPISPVTHELMVRLDPIARRLIIGQLGNAITVPLRAGTIGGVFEAQASFALPLDGTPACSALVTVDKLTVTASAEGLTAQGQGQADVIFGDVIARYDVTFSLAGPRDTTAPTLGPDQAGVDPLGELFLAASEPLAMAATARLTMGAARVELVTRGATLAEGFGKPAALALGYGATYQVEVNPWRDLAQNPGRPLPTISTLPARDLSPEDGFESAGAILGDAPVVQTPGFPVIAGKKSVMVNPFSALLNARSERFTVRLARQGNDAVVRVTLRPISQYQGTVSTYGVRVRIAVPGGAIVESPLPATETTTTRFDLVPPPGGFYVGDARTVTIALPAMTGPEIIFDLQNRAPPGCGLFPPQPGYLIDDLRID